MLDPKEKKKLKKKQKKRDKKFKQQMALFSQFDEDSTQVSADAAHKELAKGPKRKGKQGNKLSQEEIDNLTAEELEKYILNEGNNHN